MSMPEEMLRLVATLQREIERLKTIEGYSGASFPQALVDDDCNILFDDHCDILYEV